MAPVPPMRDKRRREIEQHDHLALAQHTPERGQEPHVSDIGGRVIVRAIAVAVTNRYRLHMPMRIDHRLQQ